MHAGAVNAWRPLGGRRPAAVCHGPSATSLAASLRRLLLRNPRLEPRARLAPALDDLRIVVALRVEVLGLVVHPQAVAVEPLVARVPRRGPDALGRLASLLLL